MTTQEVLDTYNLSPGYACLTKTDTKETTEFVQTFIWEANPYHKQSGKVPVPKEIIERMVADGKGNCFDLLEPPKDKAIFRSSQEAAQTLLEYL